ncbi:Calcium/calmodulin-dependent protein kinase type 1G [Cytospora mali]|uniref:Calcium/calmodulin-dependent protein kinase type 1G n=1 Tax=Cytospora mali TaxID=578113 RepID=A0A194VDB7_CYTMA|nr:Calcium/calmodulin-dependent protein kinase type 1G [Valsa mali var. pyri (nom. inval.)]
MESYGILEAGAPCASQSTTFLTIEFKLARDLGSPKWRGKAATFNGNTDDACTILADISSALAYIAEKGTVHNDVKAPNILYDGRVYLIDFGLSRVMADEAKDAGGGTPWYIAPEKQDRVPISDVWSLGIVMLYVMGEITLPDVGPAWDIYKANTMGSKDGKMRFTWIADVEAKREGLLARVTSSKELRLRELVNKMLKNKPKGRIDAYSLAEATK